MRKCVFCNNKATTKEDVWPLWLMKHFPTSSISRMDAERRGRKLGSWHMPKPKLQVRYLCVECNNGWMSVLESEAKPILESILDDKLNNIDATSQSILARWAIKTAMVLEYLNPDRTRFYSDDERQLMCATQSLPSRTSVWIAKCINQPNIYCAAKDHWTTKNDGGIHAYVTTMAFGSLAFQIVSIKTPTRIPQNAILTYDVTEGPWGQTLLQVWPIIQESVRWPAQYGLNSERGLDALTERLGPV